MIENIKQHFPTLANSPQLAYFDSAASTQTLQCVIDAMNNYYTQERCNVHRGDYKISVSVSEQCEIAREQVAELINAHSDNIIFTSGATEGLNMIANWYKDVPVVFITEAEHSANIIPWLMQGRSTTNGRLVVLPVDHSGRVDVERAASMFEKHPNSLLSIIHTSNVTGQEVSWQGLALAAHNNKLTVCIDACQAVGTHYFDVKEQPIDFAVFSGHKMYGPTGVGALYCKHDVNALRALKFGGGAVTHYDVNGNIEFVHGAHKHEPGTPNIAGIIGMGVAAEWIRYTGYDQIKAHINDIESWLFEEGLFNISGINSTRDQLDLQIRYTKDASRTPNNIFSFTVQGAHPSDIGALLGNKDVAVRTGKLCAHPLVNKLSNNGVIRVSWGIYNTQQDCKKLVEELCKAIQRLT